eukprot:TRINITY_DN4793_c0_g1::TRINITY_DN4793_c0_g1_i1::g.21286::m.21286 TRINITY_DN4793_c0_g1::TRINITY_DN4793_c0_g1_i1::g.21286  ORF type:complete len:116 (-),score=10.03,TMEM238/PF15125.1/0.096,TMEM238/PF15125.1/5.9e+03,HisKA_3/PF07730.8/0.16,HisKA_3/PF07730.8/1.4e+04 TRINITY_DN4793_c0_g1_i1:101-448(-)
MVHNIPIVLSIGVFSSMDIDDVWVIRGSIIISTILRCNGHNGTARYSEPLARELHPVVRHGLQAESLTLILFHAQVDIGELQDILSDILTGIHYHDTFSQLAVEPLGHHLEKLEP